MTDKDLIELERRAQCRKRRRRQRSAGFQPAVSPTSKSAGHGNAACSGEQPRPQVGNLLIQQIGNLRYFLARGITEGRAVPATRPGAFGPFPRLVAALSSGIRGSTLSRPDSPDGRVKTDVKPNSTLKLCNRCRLSCSNRAKPTASWPAIRGFITARSSGSRSPPPTASWCRSKTIASASWASASTIPNRRSTCACSRRSGSRWTRRSSRSASARRWPCGRGICRAPPPSAWSTPRAIFSAA